MIVGESTNGVPAQRRVLLDVGQDPDPLVDIALGQFASLSPSPTLRKYKQRGVEGIRTAFGRRVGVGGDPDAASTPGGRTAQHGCPLEQSDGRGSPGGRYGSRDTGCARTNNNDLLWHAGTISRLRESELAPTG